MELWIRSQDKELLIKVDRIGIEEFDNGYGIVTYERIGTKNEFGLGLYKSKERALEVLNEIQSILNLKDMYKYDRELVLKSWKNIDAEQVKTVREQMSVYEMPK